jgi:large subunit ribosomal protein L33
MRDFVKLMCTEKGCGSMYFTTKNKKTQTKKIEVKKYCKFSRKHTVHKESK